MVLQSATIVPGAAPAMTPLASRSTLRDIAVSPTHRNTHSDNAATSRGDSQAVPFPSAASFSALPAVCDHNATSWPAINSLRAIDCPIRPNPRNPSFAIRLNGTNEATGARYQTDLSGSDRLSQAALRGRLREQ